MENKMIYKIIDNVDKDGDGGVQFKWVHPNLLNHKITYNQFIIT